MLYNAEGDARSAAHDTQPDVVPRTSAKPFDASFDAHDRYTVARDAAPCQVLVSGSQRSGQVIGRNGPRVHVRYTHEQSTFVRWFDTEDVRPGRHSR